MRTCKAGIVATMIALVAACSDPSPSAAPGPPPPPPSSLALPVVTELATTWSGVETTPDCFFFSGPYGEDDVLVGPARLERDGVQLRLTIARAHFDGAHTGDAISLYRMSAHEFDGPWLAFESLHGHANEREVVLRYRYHECEVGAACPGRCTITGDLRLAVR